MRYSVRRDSIKALYQLLLHLQPIALEPLEDAPEEIE